MLTEQLKRVGVLLEDQLLASIPMVEEVFDHSACSRPLPPAEDQLVPTAPAWAIRIRFAFGHAAV